MRGAETVTSDDSVVARVICNGIEEGSVDLIACLVPDRMKDVGSFTIGADGFPFLPVHHAKRLQSIHIVLETE